MIKPLLKSTLILSACACICLTNAVFAQCTPDANATGLYSPDDTQGIPEGYIDQNYSTTITMNAPADTTVGGFTLTLDSVVLTQVNGLPAGFSFECDPAGCSFPGGTTGCVALTGFTDNDADVGEWPLTTTFTFYGKQGPLPITYPYTDQIYTLKLNAATSASTAPDTKDLRFTIGPNPVTKLSRLTFELPKAGAATIKVYNLVGSVVHSTRYEGETGENTLAMSSFGLDAGIYFVELSQEQYTRSARFVIQD